MGYSFAREKRHEEKFKENLLSKIFGIINGLTSNLHVYQFPNICKAFLCILQFYAKNRIATNRGATKYQCTDKGYGMQPGPENNCEGSTCSNSVTSANSLVFLLYSSFCSRAPKRIFQALIGLLKPKYQQYQEIDSLVVWLACSTIPRAGRCGCLIHHPATIKTILGRLWLSTSL